MSDQLGKKDEQISQLNEATQKQAVHIQSLIQENSKLNMELLPEIFILCYNKKRKN
jgi:regulator of replication initiation timing